jgi:hypothetical protein
LLNHGWTRINPDKNRFDAENAARSDAVSFKAEDIDRPTRTIAYFRQMTGSQAQFTIRTALDKVLQQLPTTGALFPHLPLSPSLSQGRRVWRDAAL